ncbi:sigma-54-dependent Fis family transcriptional regulator [Pseudomonas sp. v388]|uniref:sigma-54 interaction domain-containing protein n=1 Tax=Pseudomonas sp. v388 TaxID=2479849 RepID=UPI000F78914B|nr:sigma 54-interacting transcriptional regulator [Pseudomonas sp. v388]RRV05418.1 sigma-54-dependent Fis family transcriptional regulator [Pseudomonas sp. v388]
MFTPIPEPLVYAQRFCNHYGTLAQAGDRQALADELVKAVCELTGCELSQLFCLDANHSSLRLLAQNTQEPLRSGVAHDADYSSEQLLQFSLGQNRTVSLAGNPNDVYDLGFLPAGASAWRSLLCRPLPDRGGQVVALLVCATPRSRSLEMYESSLGVLGAFAVSQMQLLQRLKPSAVAAEQPTPTAARTSATTDDYGLIGRSAGMVRTRHLISKVLQTSHTVLLTGETGTGKEVVSRAIHDHGPRRSKPFVVQNCAAFPESLLESELFGYRKGAFTGAESDRPGLLDTANGGTLMLDEIGDMPLSLQAKLLRVLQEGEIRPLGSNVTRKVDVRIIAATHRDLPAMIAEGRFRADLYYRLAQFPIALPALRERGDDVLELAAHFAREASRFIRREPVHWSEAALAMLAGYRFPGNVRELKGMIERAVLLCEGECLQVEDFAVADTLLADSGMFTLRERLEAFERELLLQCLRSAGGNRSLAARQLGVARRTLLYRMAHLEITPVSTRANG